jgi:hypothetical protein
MKLSVRLAIVLAFFLLLSWSKASAIDGPDDRDAVARRADIYCTGYISDTAPANSLQVIGGENEHMQNTFSQGNVVFLDRGRESGVHSGAVYYIIRPLGLVRHPFTKKRLGHFVRELGMLRVLEVQDRTATAEILVSCDQVELGDLLKPYEEMKAPVAREGRPLPRYGEGSGGVRGRIVMSPQLREYFSANNIVYLDLGDRQGVNPGDYFTIFRKINNREKIVRSPEDDIVQERSGGYGSRHYRGGTFSQSSGRVSREEVLRKRPAIPRKVLGELVILKVEKNTAVALITRTNAEVNIGDFVERSN